MALYIRVFKENIHYERTLHEVADNMAHAERIARDLLADGYRVWIEITED